MSASDSHQELISHHDKLLIVDFGSQVTQLIARRVREAGVYCEIAPFQKAEAAFAALRPRAVILSGSPASVLEPGSPRAPQAIFDSGVPVMGIYHYETGDVFVENDPIYGSGGTETEFATDQFEAYALAYHGVPGHPTVGARLDRIANIYRPALAATTDAIGPYFSETVGAGAELPLVLADGEFSFGANGATPAGIPVGVMTYSREFGPVFKGVPGSTNSVRYFFYIPPLQGVTLQEGDRILIDGTAIAQTSAGRYVVHGPWVQYAGLVGYQFVCERMIADG